MNNIYSNLNPLHPGTIFGTFNPPGYGAGQHPGGYPLGYVTSGGNGPFQYPSGQGFQSRYPNNVYEGNPRDSTAYSGNVRSTYGDIARGQGYPGYGTVGYNGNNGAYPGQFGTTLGKPWEPQGWDQQVQIIRVGVGAVKRRC